MPSPKPPGMDSRRPQHSLPGRRRRFEAAIGGKPQTIGVPLLHTIVAPMAYVIVHPANYKKYSALLESRAIRVYARGLILAVGWMQPYSRPDLPRAWIAQKSLLCGEFFWAVYFMKIKEVIRILKANGFRLDRTRGSHRQFEGLVSGRRRLVTVSGKENQEVKKSTFASLRRQSGLPPNAFSQERAGK